MKHLPLRERRRKEKHPQHPQTFRCTDFKTTGLGLEPRIFSWLKEPETNALPLRQPTNCHDGNIKYYVLGLLSSDDPKGIFVDSCGCLADLVPSTRHIESHDASSGDHGGWIYHEVF